MRCTENAFLRGLATALVREIGGDCGMDGNDTQTGKSMRGNHNPEPLRVM